MHIEQWNPGVWPRVVRKVKCFCDRELRCINDIEASSFDWEVSIRTQNTSTEKENDLLKDPVCLDTLLTEEEIAVR
jgi:hypothetical protein